eukprot:CAMPEP_0176465746 /NCGR_PEP_ID=MMETSP0127-20121128/37477_1 /TAXON_ID=938130 /ORGANISM="Platyophrya macrostoma, Strain WH" /LENGTH=798 /DNA_ID=CAMNT_0017858775 /DNA_START=95 /DNA_END=2491 /DNA_ORIENTATION=+
MAEARRAVDPFPSLTLDVAVDPSNPTFQAHVSEKGVSLFVPKPGFVIKNIWKSMKKFYNKMHQAFMPLPVPFVFSLVLGTVSFMTLAPGASSKSLRNSKLSNFVWRLDNFINPFAHGFHNELRVAYLSLNTSVAILLSFTFMHRSLLRALLSYHGWMDEVRGRKSMKTTLWGMLLKYLYIRGGSKVMLAYQTSLPHLPVPKLQDTTSRYMESMSALLDEKEAAVVKAELDQFLVQEGPKLQWYLKYKYYLSNNYIADWWLDFVYLRGRDSLMINSNFYGLGMNMDVPTKNQAARAAFNVYMLLHVAQEIAQEKIPPMLIQGLVPMCMQQYVGAFGTTRIPQPVQDKLVHYELSESRHIAILHKGRVFKLRVLTGSEGKPASLLQLYDAFEGILRDESPANTFERQLPALTAWDRTKWAREECFLRNPVNRSALESIERALLVVSLDDIDYEYTEFTKLGNLYMHGETGTNRWFDKSANLIVSPKGYCAINVEHSWADAPCFGHCFELCMARETRLQPYLPDGHIKEAEEERAKTGNLKPIAAQRVNFQFPEHLKVAITEAASYAQALIDDLDLVVRHYKPYGKNVIKKLKCSPDAFVQMAMQLAFFRNQGTFVQTYESAMARLFVDGRTETIRSCSKESCEFVKAMLDPNVPKEDRLALLRAACTKHSRTTALAMTGRGVDRHLFALYVVSVGTETESPFLKRALGRGWKLSTSQTPMHQSVGEWPNEKENGDLYPRPSGGFGPVADDGYGVSYAIHGEKYLYFHVSSKKSCPKTNSDAFANEIFKALDEMGRLHLTE